MEETIENGLRETKKASPNLSKLNWDNEFSIRFEIPNQVTLNYVPDNIFTVELPEMKAVELAETSIASPLKITLRSMVDGSVEQEVFDKLFGTLFDVNVSLSNPNKTVWVYKDCSIDKIMFSPLIHRNSKSQPFNFTLVIKVSKIIHCGRESNLIFGGDDMNSMYYAPMKEHEGVE